MRPGACRGPPPEAGGAPGTVTYGLNLQAWCVFLMVMHHVPVERCADILGSMSGTRPSDGWVHACSPRGDSGRGGEQDHPGADHPGPRGLRRRDAYPVRPGPRTKKRYLQVACTSLLTYYFLGSRDLPSFKDFIYSDLHGTVIVHDRYVNYDHFTGVSHQLCTAHLLRDIEDAVKSTRTPSGPARSQRPCAASSTRQPVPRPGPGCGPREDDRGAPDAVPPRRHRRAIQVRRVPGAKSKQPPAGSCWNACATAKPTCCGFSPTPPSPRPATRPNATCGPPRPSRRSASAWPGLWPSRSPLLGRCVQAVAGR